MKRIWITMGPTACGKTPFVNEFFKDRPHFTIEWKQIEKENPYKDKRYVYSIVMHRLKLALLDKRPKFDNIIIDSTNLEFNQRANYYKLIEKYAPGSDITIIYWPNNLTHSLYWNSVRAPEDRVSDTEVCKQNSKMSYPFEIDPMNIMIMPWEPVVCRASTGENPEERGVIHVPNVDLLPNGLGTLELHSSTPSDVGNSRSDPVVVVDRMDINETIKAAAKRIVNAAIERLEQSGHVSRRNVQKGSNEQQVIEITIPKLSGG